VPGSVPPSRWTSTTPPGSASRTGTKRGGNPRYS